MLGSPYNWLVGEISGKL